MKKRTKFSTKTMRRHKKVTPLTAGETRHLIETLPKGRGVEMPEGAVMLDINNKPLDLAAQPRAKACGVCASTNVNAHIVLMDPTSLGQHEDPAAMKAMVVGVCAECESLGPDIFGPAVMRRLADESWAEGEKRAIAEVERRGFANVVVEDGRLRSVNGKRVEVALVGAGDAGIFRNGVGPAADTDTVIFTDLADRWWIAPAEEVRS